MFDGKHIHRRAINLGSSSSNNNNSTTRTTTTTNTRLSVLQEAQIKREQRQLYIKRNTAVIQIQRIVRGYLALKYVCSILDFELTLTLLDKGQEEVTMSFSDDGNVVVVDDDDDDDYWLPIASKLILRISFPFCRIPPCSSLSSLSSKSSSSISLPMRLQKSHDDSSEDTKKNIVSKITSHWTENNNDLLENVTIHILIHIFNRMIQQRQQQQQRRQQAQQVYTTTSRNQQQQQDIIVEETLKTRLLTKSTTIRKCTMISKLIHYILFFIQKYYSYQLQQQQFDCILSSSKTLWSQSSSIHNSSNRSSRSSRSSTTIEPTVMIQLIQFMELFIHKALYDYPYPYHSPFLLQVSSFSFSSSSFHYTYHSHHHSRQEDTGVPLVLSLFHTFMYLQQHLQLDKEKKKKNQKMNQKKMINHHEVVSSIRICKQLFHWFGQICTFLTSSSSSLDMNMDMTNTITTTTTTTTTTKNSTYCNLFSSMDCKHLFITLLFTLPTWIFQSFIHDTFTIHLDHDDDNNNNVCSMSLQHEDEDDDEDDNYSRHVFKCAIMYFDFPSFSSNKNNKDKNELVVRVYEWLFNHVESFLSILLLVNTTYTSISSSSSSSSSSSMNEHVVNTIRQSIVGKQIRVIDNILYFLLFILDLLKNENINNTNNNNNNNSHPILIAGSLVSPSSSFLFFLSTFMKYLSTFLTTHTHDATGNNNKNIAMMEDSHRLCIRILSSCVVQDGGKEGNSDGNKIWSLLKKYQVDMDHQDYDETATTTIQYNMDLSTDILDIEGKGKQQQRVEEEDSNKSDMEDDDDDDDDDEIEEQEETAHMPTIQSAITNTMNSNNMNHNPLLERLSNNNNNSFHASLPSRQKKAKSSLSIDHTTGWKLTKDDLRTASQLDSLYKHGLRRNRIYAIQYLDHLMRMDFKNDLLEIGSMSSGISQVQSMARIAMILGDGDFLMKLYVIMSTSIPFSISTTTTTATTNKNDFLDSFISLLTLILSSCSGIDSRQNTPQLAILSKFSFNMNLLEILWSKIMILTSKQQFLLSSKDIMLTKITFCDLFAHHLLAMDDDHFLQSFTKNSNTRIEIQEVIIMLKDTLWDVYWTKPVTRQDVFSSVDDSLIYPLSSDEPLIRLRFFLSGTKLFNDLYERWSRVINNTLICDESLWWFASLPLLDDSGAVSAGTTTAEGFINSGRPQNDDMDMDDHDLIDDRHGDDTRLSSKEETQNDALASCFKDPKLARILTSIPQVLPFDRRAKMFHALLNVDKEKRQIEEMASMHALTRAMLQGIVDENTALPGREQVTIRRDALYQDSQEQLSSLGKRLRRQVKVSFVNQHGANEAGIDGGGVFREFLDDLIKDAFDPSKSHNNLPPLFSESSTQLLCINLSAKLTPQILKHYEFCGQIIGKAVYESVLVEAQFCLPFLNQLLGKHNSLDDLKNLDLDFHKHLVSLRQMKNDDIESLGLTFEMGNSELVPNGGQIIVTKENVIRYIHLIAHRRLNQDTSYQTRAFLKGFRDLIPAPWVRLFSARELQKMIGGDDSIKGIDVHGLKAAMQYSGGYHPSQPIIHWFWEILFDMSANQQRKFLKFMTSCSRQPLLGFQSLVPLPCIQQIRFSETEYELLRVNARIDCRLPTSSTCMNLLKLPNYPNKELLKSKILYAIESGSGFELS